MRKPSKFMSLLLAFTMVLAVFAPTGLALQEIFADEAGTVIIAGSDFQAVKDTDATAVASCANVASILNAIKKDYPAADGLIFCGDYDKDLPSANVQTSINALKSTVSAAYPSMDSAKMFFVQGNHDQVSQGTNGLSGPGAHDTAEYGLYIIDEDDYQWKSGSSNEAKIKTTASNLKKYLDDKANANYDKPIFVASHVPLHYSVRTQEGDAKYGKYIFDVLNEAGKAGLTIIFLYGHDHSQGWDNYLGGSSVFLTEGDKINIAKPDGEGKSYESYDLHFTYMNAGYVGYYADFEPTTDYKNKDSGVDKTITMTVFEIKDGKVTVSRYDADGLHNLKSAGAENLAHPDRNNPELNDKIVKSGYEIILPAQETEESEAESQVESEVESEVESQEDSEVSGEAGDDTLKPVEISDEKTGISVNGVLTGLEIEELSNTKSYPGIAKYKAYDFTVSGYTQGTEAEVSIPIPEGYKEALVKVYYLNEKGELEDQNAVVANGFATFIAKHFSTYVLAQGKEVDITNWVKVEIPGEATYTYTLDSDGIDSGAKYIIVGGGSNNYVMTSTGSTSGNGTSVTISSNTIKLGTNAYEWIISYVDGTGYHTVDINADGFNDNQYTLSNPGNYYYLNSNGNYRQVQSAVCTRSGGYQNRSYSWTITYTRNYGGTSSVTQSGRTLTLYQKDSAGYTFVQNDQYAYFNGSDDNAVAINTRDNVYLWNVTRDGSSYKVAAGTATDRTLRYYGGFGIGKRDDNRVRLFKLTNTEYTVAETYYLGMAGDTSYSFSLTSFANEAALKAYLKQYVEVYKADDTNGTNIQKVDYTLSGSVQVSTVGTYTYTVSYDGHEVGELSIAINNKKMTGLSFKSDADKEAEVYRGAALGAFTGGYVIASYDDGSAEPIAIRLNMLTGEFSRVIVGTYSGLTVNYNGFTTTPSFTLHVIDNPDEEDYPEYPHEGSVTVDKSGKGIDFENTGVAKVELSAKGIPAKEGIDVIVMVDTSSSMKYGAKDGTDAVEEGSQRIDFLRKSLRAMLEKFSEKNEDNTSPDVRLVLADFNGYTSNNQASGWPIPGMNNVGNSSAGNRQNLAEVFTGDHTLSAGALEQVGAYTDAQIDDLVSQVIAKSGTNYDYAFDAIYRIAYDIKLENAKNGEERALYVIFMSDGCPYSFNYYVGGSSGESGNNWSKFLKGEYTAANVPGNNQSYKSFYNAATNNTHRMADAIKGNENTTYTVISPTNDLPGSSVTVGRNNDYMYDVTGLGATVYSIGFCIYSDNNVTADAIRTTISRVASDEAHFFNVQGSDSGDDEKVQAELDEAFTQISTSIRKAATNAYFVDTMGDAYDMQRGMKVGSGERIVDLSSKGITPAIEVNEYTLYTRTDYENGTITDIDLIGTRTGETKLLEKVTFSINGNEAYSNVIGEGNNILVNGVIFAKNFWYNTNDTTVRLDTDNDGKADFALAPETFRWELGTVSNKEFAISYYVYLTGSMEGERASGTYPTNDSAVLYYTNWIDHSCHQDTVSPVLPWGEATVRYAYYLVDADGNVVVNRSTGETGSFANRVVLKDPTVLKSVKLNNGCELSIDADGELLLPEGYEFFDPEASYKVQIFSGNDTASYWKINGGEETLTTYVTDFDGNAFSKETDVDADEYADYDFTHTTVWFAVKYELQCVPDTVVIDYGIPVDISAIANDMFGHYGSLAGIGKSLPDGVTDTKTKTKSLAAGFGTSVDLTYGKAEIVDGMVRYGLNAMQMPEPEVFYYAIRYNKPESDNNGYYYASITVIPATTVYFEDSFITFEDGWQDKGSELNKIQDEDRPGFATLDLIQAPDANNIYGYDPANGTCATYSLGSSKWITVSASNPVGPKASFTFTGTGFDVISLTSKDTGFVKVEVYEGEEATGTPKFNWGVDTFYGYDSVAKDGFIKYVWTIGEENVWHVIGQSKTTTNTELADGEIDATATGLPLKPVKGQSYVIFETNYLWKVTASSDNALYQIPIIKSYDQLAYGTYTVVLTPIYSGFFEHVSGSDSYDIYLDAIRVYAPAEGNTTAENAYKQDKEAYPQYIEIRENLITKDSFGNPGAVFIDAFGKNGTVSEFTSFGPNNEVYLMPGQAIAFQLEAKDAAKLASVHLGAKALNGEVRFTVISGEKSETRTLNTATDMYYSIGELLSWSGNESDVIIITNESGAILSLTTVKLTYTANPEAPAKMFMTLMAGGTAAKRVFASYVSAHTETPAPVEEEVPVIENPVFEEPAEEPEEEPAVIVPEEIPEIITEEIPEEIIPAEEPAIVPEQPIVPAEEITEPVISEEDVVIDIPEQEEIPAETEAVTELPEPEIEEIQVSVAKEKKGLASLVNRVVTAVKAAVKAIARLFGLK